uniref:Vacuolar protein sorting-associated protein 53 homolog n=1 Tax=Heliothis virescens TaxID=7102 RepID=A0A2A4JZ57_HELVI
MDLGAEVPEVNLEKPPALDGDGDNKDEPDVSGVAGGSAWVGQIGACFEPYLSLYVSSLDANLSELMDRFTQDAKSPAGEGAGGGSGAGAVIASCADLFLFYKKCLVQCARLTTGEPMLELAGVFQKYLRLYAQNVLAAQLPRGAAPGLLPALGLQALLRDQPDADRARYSRQELAKITSVITTAEYCLETTVHLEQKLKEKISWVHFDTVGDQSSYVTQIVMHLRNTVPELRDSLASSRKYFTQFCIRFANSFIPKFIQHVYRCKPLCCWTRTC